MLTNFKSFGKRFFPFFSKRYFWFCLIFFLGIFFVIQYYSKKTVKIESRLPVVIATAEINTVPITLTALGSVTAESSVTVQAQVNGVLSKLYFIDGAFVRKNQLLAEIDARPYVAQVKQYEGQLAHDQALLVNAKLDLARYKTLWKENSIAKQTLDTQVALVHQDEGTVESDQGQLQNAKVNLSYCKIISPINGRAGIALVDEGNLIQTSTPGIVVINSVMPIKVIFSIPQDDIQQVMDQLNAHHQLIVQAYDRLQQNLLATGTLLTLDNQIDPSTGTIKLEAIFQNKEAHLFPNQFVNIKLIVRQLKDSIMIPTAAVQQGTKGPFVYLFTPSNNKVHIQPIKIGVTIDNKTSVIGISPKDKVVISGADKLVEGSTVTAIFGKTSE